MPIRTNRGRAAVYRRLWGWPMRSPTHLVGTVVFLVALMVAAGILVPRLVGDTGTAPVPSGAAGSAREGTTGTTGAGAEPTLDRETLPTRLSEPLATPTPVEPAPEALRVAKQWATAWVSAPDSGADGAGDAWLESLRPHTTEEFLPQLSTVDPGNVEATKVVGEPKARESYPKSVKAEITTDGPVLLVTVIETGDGWKVSDYTEATG
ncbi:hypothetical protein SAXI111661_21250 [Saccharomonospora xinjiangensis]|uniref:hypothetical protein n=1 Tax=Saccharomonospora xinjiangensis TaxID=75294 RepID=UPI00106F4532|nr:hypothetical protein [Saccharomonospora xinjiangensis]QBQ59177.1 hypothetical protein EYD13_03990 [Saccharomonospora xinjiangensis]